MDLQTFFDREWRYKWLDIVMKTLTCSNISANENLTMEMILEHLDEEWNWAHINRNPNLTIDFARKFKNKLYWFLVSENSAFTMEMIENNPDLPWKMHGIANNPNLTFDYVIADGYATSGICNLRSISMNSAMTLEIIENYPDFPWDYEYISANPNLTIEFIRKHPNANWNWSWISYNENITMDVIENNPDLPWNTHCISKNPNLTFDMILSHPDYEWNWCEICGNMKITINDLKQYPNFPWKFAHLSANKYLTFEMLREYTNKSWDCDEIGNCPFSIDKQFYILHQTANILLLQIYEYYRENPYEVTCVVEQVLFDDYLLKNVIKY
jgi:hypothetical protein